MATKKFIIEVEEGRTECEDCPFALLKCGREDLDNLDCLVVNLATMKIKELEEDKMTKEEMKEKIFDDMNAGPFKAKVDERFHKLGHDCPDDGWVTGYLLRDLHQGDILPHIFNCPCTWIVKEETIEPVGFHIAQWIKVEDRLPEVNEYVLCATKGGKYMINSMYIPKDCKGNILGTKEWRGSIQVIESITHWMPVIPPKED